MGILSNLDATSVVIFFLCLAAFNAVRLLLLGRSLRVQGFSKSEVKVELRKAIQSDPVLVALVKALRSAPDPTTADEPERQAKLVELPPPKTAGDAEERSSSP